jgi:NAD(P)-dependent dehydrogenase (short-subunit alcohol dehydrogenase family)
MLLRDRTAVITGNSFGIGEATAKLFAEHGATVLCIGDDPDFPWKDDGTQGSNIKRYSVDTSDRAAVMAFAAQCERELPHLDILFNVTGRALVGTFENTEYETWTEAIDRNLNALFICSRAFLGIMKRRPGGAIINHGSIDGQLGNPSLAGYSAAKAGVVALTHVMAHDLGASGIRVNCISTGGIRSGGTLRGNDALVALTPVGRTGTPADVAHIALFLASDWSAYVNGANLIADGGRTTITQGCYGGANTGPGKA